MTDDGSDDMFDLSSALEQALAFEDQMADLSGIAVPRAAEAMADAFEAAGTRIEAALSRAAKSGQFDFEQMVSSILGELARLAANAMFDQLTSGIAGMGAQQPPVSINLSVPEGADAGSILAAQGQIASALGQAVLAGGRFS